MGRRKKYKEGTEIMSFSLGKEVANLIRDKASKNNVPISTFIVNILKCFAMNDADYSRMMARIHARELYYWQQEIDRLKEDKNES